MGLSFGIVDILILAVLLTGWFIDRRLERSQQETRRLTLRAGLGTVLILYGLYIGKVWPFAVIVAMGVVYHLHEKMEAQKQIQRLRDLYRR